MTQNRKQWAAMSYPEAPEYLTPAAVAQRAKVRIGVRVALITLPLMLASGFAYLAGDGGSDQDSGPGAAAQLYPGEKIALSVRLELASAGMLPRGMNVDCDNSPADAGSVSSCDEYPQSGDGDDVAFDVHFVDAHGHFSFTATDGRVITGTLVA